MLNAMSYVLNNYSLYVIEVFTILKLCIALIRVRWSILHHDNRVARKISYARENESSINRFTHYIDYID